MTREDYVLLARHMAAARPNNKRDAYYRVRWLTDVHAICTALAEDNPRFDYGRFYMACGSTLDWAGGSDASA